MADQKKKDTSKADGKDAGVGSSLASRVRKLFSDPKSVLRNRYVMAGVGIGLGSAFGVFFGRMGLNNAPVEPSSPQDALEPVPDNLVSTGYDVILNADEEKAGDLQVGLIYLRKNRYADAVRVLLRYARSESLKGEAERITLYSGLSEGYRGLGNEDKAKAYARKCRKLVNQSGVALRLFERAEETRRFGFYSEARKLFFRFLCVAGDLNDEDDELIAITHFRIADCYQDEVLALTSVGDSEEERIVSDGQLEVDLLDFEREKERVDEETPPEESEVPAVSVSVETEESRSGETYRVKCIDLPFYRVFAEIGRSMGLRVISLGVPMETLEEETISIDLDNATRVNVLDLVCGAMSVAYELSPGLMKISPPSSALASLSDRAVWAYRLALGTFPDHGLVADAFLSIGSLFYRAENYREAIDNYQTLVNVYPDHEQVPFALLQSARGSLEQGNPGKARDFAFEVIESHSRSDAVLPACEVIVFAFIDQRMLDRADRCMKFFMKRFEVIWGFAESELALAFALLSASKYEEALPRFEHLADCPHFGVEGLDEIRLLCIRALLGLKKTEESVVALNREIRGKNSQLDLPEWKMMMGDIYVLCDMPFFAYLTGVHVRTLDIDDETRRRAGVLMIRGLVGLGLLEKATRLIEEEFDDLTTGFDRSAGVLFEFADFSLDIGDYASAERMFVRLEMVESMRSRAGLGMARSAFLQERYEDSLDILRSLLVEADEEVRSEMYDLAADCHRRLGDINGAVLALNGFLGERLP